MPNPQTITRTRRHIIPPDIPLSNVNNALGDWFDRAPKFTSGFILTTIVGGAVLTGAAGYPAPGGLVVAAGWGTVIMVPRLYLIGRAAKRSGKRAKRTKNNLVRHKTAVVTAQKQGGVKAAAKVAMTARTADPLTVAAATWAKMEVTFTSRSFPTGCYITSIRNSERGRILTIRRRGGAPASDVANPATLSVIAASFKAQLGRATILEANALKARIQLWDADEWAKLPEVMWWPMLSTIAIDRPSVTTPFPVAKTPAGREVQWVLGLGKHEIIAGTTGSGKDSTATMELAVIAYSPDGALVILDHKGGLDWGPWQKSCWAFASDPPRPGSNTFKEAVQFVRDEINHRNMTLANHGYRKATIGPPTKGKPWIMPLLTVVFSEAGLMTDAEQSLADLITTMARAVGVRALLIMQEPRQSKIGKDSAVKGNTAQVMVFQTPRREVFRMAMNREPTPLEEEAVMGSLNLARRGVGVFSVGARDVIAKAYFCGDGDSETDPIHLLARYAPTHDWKFPKWPSRCRPGGKTPRELDSGGQLALPAGGDTPTDGTGGVPLPGTRPTDPSTTRPTGESSLRKVVSPLPIHPPVHPSTNRPREHGEYPVCCGESETAKAVWDALHELTANARHPDGSRVGVSLRQIAELSGKDRQTAVTSWCNTFDEHDCVVKIPGAKGARWMVSVEWTGER
jgi:hypothetical protein